jgi:hypothetical protein
VDPGKLARAWHWSEKLASLSTDYQQSSGTAHLDRRIYTTGSNHGKVWVPFNDVYNTAIAFENIDQFPRVLIPHEPIAVVGPRHDIFVIRAKKIH